MKNIVITGGLGYLGTELCKIYSGESWKYKITVIDNKFISERVYQLHKWGIEFIKGDILDKDFLLKVLRINSDALRYAAMIIKTEKSFMLEAVKIDGMALEYALEDW